MFQFTDFHKLRETVQRSALAILRFYRSKKSIRFVRFRCHFPGADIEVRRSDQRGSFSTFPAFPAGQTTTNSHSNTKYRIRKFKGFTFTEKHTYVVQRG